MNILVTGGAGFIGSHAVVELLDAGHSPILVDNFSNSSPEAIERLEKLVGKTLDFTKLDLTSRAATDKFFTGKHIDGVIHFAGLKAVGESVSQPTRYYRQNIVSTLNLLDAMDKSGVERIIFSSSATVYGDPSSVPIVESESIKPTNPYGHTKAMIEQILQDWAAVNPSRNLVNLRYFNPIGAHPSGLIGENPNGIPNNLLPFVGQVARGLRDELTVFGKDYDTPDGTGVRDYIHVVDLAKAHIAALGSKGVKTYNVGSGSGTSVLQMIDAYQQASGVIIPYKISARRPGDIATCYANPSKIKAGLGWSTQLSVQQACQDDWNWQQTLLDLS